MRNNKNKLYVIWSNMMARCYNPKNTFYSRYGGRGIKVSKRWCVFESFEKDLVERPEGMTLERTDNDGDYCKENCRWATRKEQARNRSSSRIYQGKTVAEWSDILKLSHGTILWRINNNKDLFANLEDFKSIGKKGLLSRWGDNSLRSECVRRNISYKTVWKRIDAGWTRERALSTPIRDKNNKK